jgi:hypothetical protein
MRPPRVRKILFQVVHRHHRDNGIAPAGPHESIDGLPPGGPASLRHVQDREKVGMPPPGEGQDPPLGPGHEDPLQIVLVVPVHPRQGFPPSDPPPVEMHGDSLHKPLMAHGHHHVLVGHGALHRGLLFFPLLQENRSPGIPEALRHLPHLFQDHVQLPLFTLQNLPKPRDLLSQSLEPGLQLRMFQGRELGQAHIQNGIGLDLAEPKAVLESIRRLAAVFGLSNDGDDLVDAVQCRQKPFRDVPLRLGLLQLKPGAPADDLQPVVPEVLQHLLQVEDPGLAVIQSQ